MATHYPIVFEREESGAYSAYVAGLPVYAQGATRSKAATAIVRTRRVSGGPSRRAAARGSAGGESLGSDAASDAPHGQPGDGCRSGW